MSRRQKTKEAIEKLIKEINQIELGQETQCIHNQNSAAALLLEEFLYKIMYVLIFIFQTTRVTSKIENLIAAFNISRNFYYLSDIWSMGFSKAGRWPYAGSQGSAVGADPDRFGGICYPCLERYPRKQILDSSCRWTRADEENPSRKQFQIWKGSFPIFTYTIYPNLIIFST